MNGLSHHELTTMFLALGVLLAAARLFGEIARRLRQPSVIGEIFAGIVLGPTVLRWQPQGARQTASPSDPS